MSSSEIYVHRRDLLDLARGIAALLPDAKTSKKQVRKLRKRLRKLPDMLSPLNELLSRLESSGQIPDSMCVDSPGIRGTLSSPNDSSALDVLQRGSPVPTLVVRGTGTSMNLGKERDYPPLQHETTITFDVTRHRQLAASITKHVRQLRSYLEQLGRQTVQSPGSTRGRRLDLGRIRTALVTGSPNILIEEREVLAPSAYIGIILDRSGSMSGERIERAKRFAILVSEAARQLDGIRGHVNTFDDDTFYLAGDLRRCAIANLESGGGNNDAGGLDRAAKLALESGMRNKLIVMISDGSPTRCTFESLKHLVEHLTRIYGIICAQVAVAPIDHIAFPDYVDLSRYGTDEAVARFGRMLMRLTRCWR